MKTARKKLPSIKIFASRKPLILHSSPCLKNEPSVHGLSRSERGIEFATPPRTRPITVLLEKPSNKMAFFHPNPKEYP